MVRSITIGSQGVLSNFIVHELRLLESDTSHEHTINYLKIALITFVPLICVFVRDSCFQSQVSNDDS